MNAYSPYTEVAFFMLVKRPSALLPPITPAALQARLAFLEQAHHHSDQVTAATAQEDVDAFYQCLAHSLTVEAAWRERWVQLEIHYLATKLQRHFARLSALCKAEGVYLKKRSRAWDVKFPWEARESSFLSTGDESQVLVLELKIETLTTTTY